VSNSETLRLLCGSYNKMFDYRCGIFAELRFRFFRLLSQYEVIVMSGSINEVRKQIGAWAAK